MVTEPLRRLGPRVRDRQEGPPLDDTDQRRRRRLADQGEHDGEEGQSRPGSALAPEPGGGQRESMSQPDRQGQADDRLELVVVAEGCQSPVE